MEANTALQNDPTIPDSEFLYRAIHPDQLKEDNAVSSAAFKSRTNPHVSVDLSSLSTPEETDGRWPLNVGVVQLLTGMVRSVTPGVVRDPIEGNPAHALIIRDFNLSNSQWAKVAHELAKACSWVIGPRG